MSNILDVYFIKLLAVGDTSPADPAADRKNEPLRRPVPCRYPLFEFVAELHESVHPFDDPVLFGERGGRGLLLYYLPLLHSGQSYPNLLSYSVWVIHSTTTLSGSPPEAVTKYTSRQESERLYFHRFGSSPYFFV